jgi:hypothetical protein
MGIFNKYTPTSLEDMEEDVVVPQAETTATEFPVETAPEVSSTEEKVEE